MAKRAQANTDFLDGKLALDDKGYIQTQAGTVKTSVAGIFAAGDVQKELIDTAEREHLVLYQADIFQVPRLISLFGIQPTASLNFVGFVYASKLTKVSFLG